MTREHAERDMVATIVRLQLKKLREPQNRAKGGWENERPFELVQRLHEEVRELSAAVVACDWNDANCVEAVLSECADVANFSGFIAHNASEGRWKR